MRVLGQEVTLPGLECASACKYAFRSSIKIRGNGNSDSARGDVRGTHRGRARLQGLCVWLRIIFSGCICI